MLGVLTIVVGLACAAVLDRKGQRMAGLLAAALTGLLASPISWDHEWVWTAPCVALAGHYAAQSMAARARGAGPGQAGLPGLAARWQGWVSRARLAASSAQAWVCWAVAAGIVAVFAAWPGAWFGKPLDNGDFSFGLIFLPPGTQMATYERYGDRPRFAEYHWHGLDLLFGNAWVLAGIVLIALLIVLALYAPGRGGPGPPRLSPACPPGPASPDDRPRRGAGRGQSPSGRLNRKFPIQFEYAVAFGDTTGLKLDASSTGPVPLYIGTSGYG